MSCPHAKHGDPSSCSLCVGARPRHVELDQATGRVWLDGKLVRGVVKGVPSADWKDNRHRPSASRRRRR